MTKPITDRPLKRAGQKPWEYDESIALEVCLRISQGESLRAICEDKAMPSERTVYRWLAATPVFRQAYVRAREAQMDHWSDEIVEIADDASNDYIERIGKDGEVERVFDPEAVQRSKLRIDTRKWLMSKLAARTYGDKVDVNLSGSVEVSTLSDEELEARTRARLVALGVEIAAPLLLPMPGTARASAPAMTAAPEVDDVAKPPCGESTPTGGEPAPITGECTPSPRSTRKKSAKTY